MYIGMGEVATFVGNKAALRFGMMQWRREYIYYCINVYLYMYYIYMYIYIFILYICI